MRGDDTRAQGEACGLILLAAGASTRMGTPKPLLELGGETLVRRAARAGLAAGLEPIVVVLGAQAERVRPQLADLAVRCVENAAWTEGMGASLRVGMQAVLAAAPDLPAVIVALVDQPHFDAELIGRLRAEQGRTGKAIVATGGGRRGGEGPRAGPPVLWRREHFGVLLACRGEVGARALLAERPEWVAVVAPPAGAADLDTPEEYRRYLDRRADAGAERAGGAAEG